ncbi:MAG: hypothetical protein KQH63_06330 [Desulfobulbaceae bacterium]|nr:hypothetical protein [Desulfobulbaceae bacterium]
MISPAEIRKKALKQWQSRRFFKAELTGESFFPLIISCRKPAGAELLQNFDKVRSWLRTLKAGSRENKGFGYHIEFAEVNHRLLGHQLLPRSIVIPSREDFLLLIGKEEEYKQYRADLALVKAKQPGLLPFIEKNPGRLLDHIGSWHQLLAVVDYFLNNPRPGKYLRELDIVGVDSKFLEQNRRIAGELLDQVLPEEAIDQSVNGLRQHGFERRYYLKYDEPLIRFRILDPALCAMKGVDDLSMPVSRFAELDLPCRKVFITENKINGLSFPDHPQSLIIFGLGYGIQQLAAVQWLSKVELYYWGDIDTHGFAILSRLRHIFPRTRSFLMDSETLEHGRRLWVKEDEQHLADLDNLTGEEQGLFDDLRTNRLGISVRLEQERLNYSFVLKKINSLLAP